MLINKLFRTLLFAPVFYWAYLIFFGSLGADPAKNLNHKTGEAALCFLLLNLLVGILLSFSKAIPFAWPRASRFLLQERRWLGVITFLFLIFHLFLYWAIEGFEQKGFEQMYTKNYLIFGSLAWLIMLVLAVTSNDFSVRRLGGKKWKNLHRLAYLASALITLHVLSIEKADLIKYGSLLGALWLLQISRFFYQRGYLWFRRR
jgi:sulfoxide reductase heme-binding subunit YedZ